MTEQKSTRYSLGFLFNRERTHVVLIEKARPEWQRGKFNGIGGHVEKGESPYDAMAREANEEAGIPFDVEWFPFAIMRGYGWECHCYRAFDTQAAEEANGAADGDEKIFFCEIASLPSRPILSNLRWLIPLALDPGTKASNGQDGPRYSVVEYSPAQNVEKG